MIVPFAARAFARRCFEQPDHVGLPPRPEEGAPHAVALALAHEAASRYSPSLPKGGIAPALAAAWLRLEPEEAAVSMTATRLLALVQVDPAQRADRADQLELDLATALTVPPDPADAPHGRLLARTLFRTFTRHPDASPAEHAHWTEVEALLAPPAADHRMGDALAARRARQETATTALRPVRSPSSP